MSDSLPVTLACGGDVSLAKCVTDRVREHGAGWVFELLAPALDPADLMTFNWESPVLPTGEDPPEKGLVVPEELAAGLTESLPPCVVTVANNHMLDAGAAGVGATGRTLDGIGIAHVGAGETEADAERARIVEVDGLRIGFLGRAEDCPQLADRGFPGPAFIKYPQIVDDVRSAAAACDCLVVHLHHGVEFVDWPAPHFVRLCREVIEAGARLVLGGHPHVPQGHERRGPGHIFYCLGNLAFEITKDGYQGKGSRWTSRSALALVPVGRGEVGEPVLVPYRIEESGRPVPLAGAEAAEVLDHVAAVSADLGDEAAMQAHWRDTALRYLGIYLDWARGSCDENGHATEETVRFFSRLPMNESRMFVQELFGDADWPRRINERPWSE